MGNDLTAAMVGRRTLCRGIAALTAVVLFAGSTPVAAAQSAGDFLRNVGDRAIDLLSDGSATKEQREQEFMEMLQAEFDVPRISRFIVGRYWRKASEQEQKDFIEVFSKVMAQRFLPLFDSASKDQFSIGNEREDKKPGIKFVDMSITTTDGKTANTIWRVVEENNTFKILDVVVEGASMAITLRSEYGGVIKQNSGKLEKLTALLRQKVN